MNASINPVDPNATTQPTRPSGGLDSYQPMRLASTPQSSEKSEIPKKGGRKPLGCLRVFFLFILIPLLLYFFFSTQD